MAKLKRKKVLDNDRSDASLVIQGPTPERLRQAEEHYTVGNDTRAGKVYTIADSQLDRLYARLVKGAKRQNDVDQLQAEYTALKRYRKIWDQAGLEMKLSSVDPNRIYHADGNFSGMAKNERQADYRKEYRRAREALGSRAGIVVDNVVCYEKTNLEAAGYAIGWENPVQARAGATEVLRSAGETLARLWGIG